MRSLACSSTPWHRPPISPTVGAPCCRALRSALMDGSGRWRNLGIASGALAAALFAGFDLFQWVAAYGSWSALRLAALAGTWYLGAPGAGPARLIHLVAALAWLPVIYALQLGQPGLFVALGVAGSYALLRKERQFLSGLALGVMVLKPQLGFLLPFALLASGRYRAVAGAAVGIGLLSLASAVNVGPDGIAAYAQRLSFAADVPVNRELTLAFVIGGVTATRLVQGAIAIWALALAYRLRKQRPDWMFVLAILGGLLVTPYLHLDDLVMLGLAVWLYLRIPGRPRWSWAFVLALVIAAEGIPEWGPLPFIAGEIAFLVLLSVAALGRQPDHAEHHKVVDAVAVNSRDGRPLR